MARALYIWLISRRENGRWFVSIMESPMSGIETVPSVFLLALSPRWLRLFREGVEDGRTVSSAARRASHRMAA